MIFKGLRMIVTSWPPSLPFFDVMRTVCVSMTAGDETQAPNTTTLTTPTLLTLGLKLHLGLPWMK